MRRTAAGHVPRKAAEFGNGGVRSHLARFSVAAWDEPPGTLSSVIPRSGRISRGDVLDLGTRVRAGTCRPQIRSPPASSGAPARPVTGRAATAISALQPGTGLSRHCSVSWLRSAGTRAHLTSSRATRSCTAAMKKSRAAAGQEPWSRLHKFGPAFFTKFLYFSTPGALILDNRVARAVHERSGLPHLVTGDGRSLAWTPYRYAVYLHWMQQTARAVDTTPEMLEAAPLPAARGPLGGGGRRRLTRQHQPPPSAARISLARSTRAPGSSQAGSRPASTWRRGSTGCGWRPARPRATERIADCTFKPYIGTVPLAALTSARLTALYRELETSGRRYEKGERTGPPLSARTVRYIHTISAACSARRSGTRACWSETRPPPSPRRKGGQGSRDAPVVG